MRSERHPFRRVSAAGGLLRAPASLPAPPRVRLRALARAVLRAVALAVLLAGLLAGCGGLAQDKKPRTPFGPGTGGPTSGPYATYDIPDTANYPFGQLEYDTTYWAPITGQTPTSTLPNAGVLISMASDVSMQLTLIFGRPDTPCRFQAALAARDDGFTIEGDGADKINALGVDFAEVQLHNGNVYWRLDCAQLSGNLGVGVLTQTTPTDQRHLNQVHYVLNSIQP
jgi:hypothetical protein